MINVWEVFLKKCDSVKIRFSEFENKCFNRPYKDFFNDPELLTNRFKYD